MQNPTEIKAGYYSENKSTLGFSNKSITNALVYEKHLLL